METCVYLPPVHHVYLHVLFKQDSHKHYRQINVAHHWLQQEAQFKKHAQMNAHEDFIANMLRWIRISFWIKAYKIVFPIGN